MKICKSQKFVDCFHMFYIINANKFSVLSYVPCAFYLFKAAAACFSNQARIMCSNNVLKIIHFRRVESAFRWKLKAS